MSTLIHRRRIHSASSEAGGPGSTIGPLLRRATGPLTWIGWLSIVGAVGYAAVSFIGGRPVEFDEFTPIALLHEAAVIATILLPAALEFGYPGVARRNPWLLRGTLLLALALLSRPITGFVQDWASTALFQTADGGQLDQIDMQFAVGQTLALTGGLLQALGWLLLLRGLVEAGARPRDSVLVAFAVAGVAIWVGALLPSLGELWSADRAIASAANAIAILVGVCHSAATAGVVAALLAGAFRRLQPHLGWAIGLVTGVVMAAASIAVLAQVVLGPSMRPDGSQDYWLLTVLTALNSASSVLLLAACFAGIGRGTDARRGAWTMRRGYSVSGDRRLRPAGG